MLSHLADRETTYTFEAHLDDWTSWALAHGVHKMVTGFIRMRPSALHDFDPQRDKNATPRGWVEGVSDAIGIVPAEAEYETYCGAVGEGRAAEFAGYCLTPTRQSCLRTWQRCTLWQVCLARWSPRLTLAG